MHGSAKWLPALALLDTGSQRTFCKATLFERLGTPVVEGELSLGVVGQDCKAMSIREGDLHVRAAGVETPVHEMGGVCGVETLPLDGVFATKADVSSYDHLSDLTVPEDGSTSVEILIGLDNHYLLKPLELAGGEREEPYGVRTPLGWTIMGPVTRSGTANTSTCCTVEEPDERLLKSLQRFWELESSGLYDSVKQMSVEDKRVLELWRDEGKKANGYFELPIPFKPKSTELQNNYTLAKRRLTNLARKLQKDPNLYQHYKAGMAELVDKGYAEPVRGAGKGEEHTIWYVPHHAVHNEKKDKPRIVFDCAAKYMGLSLNDAVYSGPDLTNSLVGVLLRFRCRKVAMMADIQAMFHQVKVPKEQRDVLRFLWYPDGDLSRSPVVYRMTSHLFGGTWSPAACAHALSRTADEHGSAYSAEASRTLKRSFYVDDCLKSVDGEREAADLAKELVSLVGEGGFKLTKWTSNSRRVLEAVPHSERSKAVTGMLPGTALEEQALGVYWKVEEDALCYHVSEPKQPLTRRGMLSALSSIYDPLGLISPYILEARHVVQEMCRGSVGWDDPASSDVQDRWRAWTAQLRGVSRLRFPRCLQTGTRLVSAELHHFADASEEAYGVVSYVRTTDETGGVRCMIVQAKSRLSPLKHCTVPRLELCAATLAARQDGVLRRELDIDLGPSTFWVDSTVVLQYVTNESRRFHTFVANRVGEIRQSTDPESWRHVPTNENPADDTTHPVPPTKLNESRWLHGPDYLSEGPESWPPPRPVKPLGEADTEVRAGCVVLMVNGTAEVRVRRRLRFWDVMVERCSSFPTTVRHVGHILAAVRRWRERRAARTRGDPEPRWDGRLSPEVLQAAERLLWRHAQEVHFPVEKAGLEKGRAVAQDSPLRKLGVRLVETMLVSEGRLKHASGVPLGTRAPLVLPAQHPVVLAYLRHVHVLNGHAGVNQVLAEVRRRFWIVGGRVAIKRLVAKCVACRRRAAKPEQAMMADLPPDRVNPAGPAFTAVGVDYFGPFMVKRGRGQEKRYGCLFTCLKTRAIHIEVAHSLDTSSFLQAFERFAARRGFPQLIRSDNGRNFVAGQKELKDTLAEWNQARIERKLQEHNVEWIFNPPYASHMGGVWERQIRTVRKVLAGLTSEQVLDGEQLGTLMAKCEGIVNARPITPVSEDPDDLEALTPNHLLLMRGSSLPGRGEEGTMPSYRRRWAQVEYMTHLFWKRWVREYLPQLRERSKWTGERKNVKEGDLVIVVDPLTPRATWPLARVTEVVESADGVVRTVKLRSPGGEMTRPIVKVCVLEEAAQNLRPPPPPPPQPEAIPQEAPAEIVSQEAEPRRRDRVRRGPAAAGLGLVRSRPRGPTHRLLM